MIMSIFKNSIPLLLTWLGGGSSLNDKIDKFKLEPGQIWNFTWFIYALSFSMKFRSQIKIQAPVSLALTCNYKCTVHKNSTDDCKVLKKILVLQSQTLTILAEVDQDKNRPSCKSTTTSHIHRITLKWQGCPDVVFIGRSKEYHSTTG